MADNYLFGLMEKRWRLTKNEDDQLQFLFISHFQRHANPRFFDSWKKIQFKVILIVASDYTGIELHLRSWTEIWRNSRPWSWRSEMEFMLSDVNGWHTNPSGYQLAQYTKEPRKVLLILHELTLDTVTWVIFYQ